MEDQLIVQAPEAYRVRVSDTIAGVDRLNELVTLVAHGMDGGRSPDVRIGSDGRMEVLPAWHGNRPPLRVPPMPFDAQKLLGVVFCLLGNTGQARSYAPAYLEGVCTLVTALAEGYGADVPAAFETGHQPTDAHNRAVACHYLQADMPYAQFVSAYEEALAQQETDEYRAYTAFHFATFLMDAGQHQKAEAQLDNALGGVMGTEGYVALCSLWCTNALQMLVYPVDGGRLSVLKANLKTCRAHYERSGNILALALSSLDAARISTYEGHFSEALACVQQAVPVFEQHGLGELAGEAHVQRAKILYTWAVGGNPQFYREALKAGNQALAVFTRGTAPLVYADLQQLLGLIYAALPDEEAKRQLWSSMSVSAFREALSVYTEADYPYEYGMICNNQGNAFLKYPDMAQSDRFASAMSWYERALLVRDARQYPVERTTTLLNWVEAAWNLLDAEPALAGTMRLKLNEIIQLDVSAAFSDEAVNQLRKLDEWKPAEVPAPVLDNG